jgi:hypothetical protein
MLPKGERRLSMMGVSRIEHSNCDTSVEG